MPLLPASPLRGLLQGWRLEVKQFPRLTEVGAWRQAGGERYGGFYTQDEVSARSARWHNTHSISGRVT